MYNETYQTDPAVAFVGMVADQTPALITSHTVAIGAIGFGKAVCRSGEDGPEGSVRAVSAGNSKVLGISVRSQATPADSPNEYPVGDNVAVLRKGAIWVEVGSNVDEGDDVYVTMDSGAFSATPSAGNVKIEGAVYEKSATSGNLALVRIV